jgi:putative flavoprotein involved in K+ transport
MTNITRDASATITSEARAARRKPTSAIVDSASIAAADEEFPVVVIGGGQAGLSVGYHLKRRGIPFVILDANARIGDQWRDRWDSLRLFTPAQFDGLDGMRFPARAGTFPTKDAMGDFLEAYAAHFHLPVRSGVRADGLDRVGDDYVVTAGGQRFRAPHVVVAMSNYQKPKVPPFAGELDPDIVQLHSLDYRAPSQLRSGGVLIVGAGNSGSEIARELATAGHPIWMSGRDTGHIPFRIEGFIARHLLVRLVIRGLFYRVLTTSTPIGRKARPKVLSQGGPLIRVKPKDLARLGVKRVPRTAGTRDGLPLLEDGQVPDVANVIWCTGFDAGFDWLHRPIFDDHGQPNHQRGIVPSEPGLYFSGLEFLYSLSSVMIHGTGRDARYVVDRIAERMAAGAS